MRSKVCFAHPLRHQQAAEFDAVAGVDGFLPIEWQAIDVFEDGDLREQASVGKPASTGAERTDWRTIEDI
jgi:hypothetical protein